MNCNTSWKVVLFMKWSDNKETILKGVSELRFLHVVVFLWGCFLFFCFFFTLSIFSPNVHITSLLATKQAY